MRKNYWAIKHDMSYSNIYRRWLGIKQRCFNPNNCNYSHYGGRGITVCDEWLDFNNFAEWSLNNGYSKELSIDRIDVNGNYEPNNCRWVNKTIQNINRRTKSKCGYVGISKNSKDGAWYGRVHINGKCYYTGRSKDINEAIKMRNDYIEEHNLPSRKNVLYG